MVTSAPASIVMVLPLKAISIARNLMIISSKEGGGVVLDTP
jgi:hypothetical protein